MKLIKCVSNEMKGNIGEAREKIRKAYELKEADRGTAMWFCDMAEAHIKFNIDGHNVVENLIESYKNSEEYKRNPEYANGMMDAWKAMHADLLAETAEVRAMIEGFE